MDKGVDMCERILLSQRVANQQFLGFYLSSLMDCTVAVKVSLKRESR